MSKMFYLTTPLYYVNAPPHIGHSYTEVAADALARYHRLAGRETFLLTGTDEHGQKIAQAAADAGKAPQAFVDEVGERFKALWAILNISHDDFIRTSEPRHVTAVQQLLTRLKDAGKLTRAEYQGWYCTPDETFWTEAELITHGISTSAPVCPTCQRSLEPAKEEGWYLKLRANQEWLRGFVRAHPDFVRPQTRYNELLGWLAQPLPEYLCITRPKARVSWGIQVPFAPDHVVYVWFDALLNYITAPGYVSDPARFASLWPAEVHLVGKDILRHHALYWPIMLHELGLPDAQMPKIFAHGWWRIGEQKMSKSLGNIVDPAAVVGGLLKGQPFAADAYRYFLLREIPFGQDGSFSEEAILKRLNMDLGNDVGNLVNRTLSMTERYFGGQLPFQPIGQLNVIGGARAMADAAIALQASYAQRMESLDFSGALEGVMGLATQANQFIETSAPWKLAKQPEARAQLTQVFAALGDGLKALSVYLTPVMPSVGAAIWTQLGLPGRPRRLEDAAWSVSAGERRIAAEHPVLFPRMEAVA